MQSRLELITNILKVSHGVWSIFQFSLDKKNKTNKKNPTKPLSVIVKKPSFSFQNSTSIKSLFF